MKFSILICSLHERSDKLTKLMNCLNPQLTQEVEVLVNTDNGELSIGAKRNLLLKQAVGEYIAFIDDDDLVSDTYVSRILEAIKSEPDCCSLEGIITFKGVGSRVFIHSLQYDHWFERDNIYYRCPNHLNVVKRELALQVGFPEINYYEDRSYSNNLFPLLKKEAHIAGTLYYYLFDK